MQLIRNILLLIVVTSALSEVTRKYTLPYCTNESVQSFKLIDPGKCDNQGNTTKQITPIKVYKPFNRVITLIGTACRRQTKTYNCILFFFGSKSCTLLKTEYHLMERKECELAYERHYTSAGRLLPDGDKTMRTRNILKPSYYWPTGKLIKVINFEMAAITITKNIVTEEFHHISMGSLSCKRKFKTCVAGHWRINYVDSQEKSCETIAKVENTTLIVHKTRRGFLFEVKQTNLIASILTKCQPDAIACLKPKDKTQFLCTLSGHVIEIPEESHVETMDTTQVEIPASLRSIQAAISTVAHGEYLNNRMLRQYLRTVTCETARANVVALMGSQKINPSEVLSLLLEKNVQATYTAGTLRQLRCSNVQAVLQPTLEYKGHISNRPLFMAYVGTEAILTSLRQGRFLSARISSTITLTKRKTFNFNGSVLIFENNTLVDRQPALKKITIKNLEIEEENFFDIQEEDLNEDFQNMAGSEEDITQQQLKNLLLLTKQEYEDEGVNIEELLMETHNMDKNLVKKMLKMIKNTFWRKIQKFLQVVSYVYATLITFLLLGILIQSLRETFQNRHPREGPNNP